MRAAWGRASLTRVRGRVRRPVRGRWRLLGRLVQAAGRGDAVSRHELLSVRGHSVAWLFPLLMLVAIAAIDVATGAFHIVSWTVLVPGVAAAICGVRATAVFAVAAVAVYVLADTTWQHRDQTGLPGLILVSLGGAIAVVAAGVRVGGERRMLHMRDIAETTRRTVLRPIPEGWGGLDHAAVYLSSDSEARVGGDFYDIQPGPHGTRVLVGDVQGKGLGAVETAAALLGTFREAAYHEADLATVAERLEVRIRRHRGHTAALGRADGDRFATAVLIGFLPDRPDVVEAVVFGHEPPLAAGPGGVRYLPVTGGLPLGMGDLVPGPPAPPVTRHALAPEETLLVVTDGVTEARDAEGRFYRHADDVARAVTADASNAAPSRLVALVRDGTLRHCRGRLSDDTTVFAVRRRPGPAYG
ncbi:MULTISPECIES: PP2C family protein-serine/threonine phosphatase [Streptomyces]|uniref:PP2C family protein-serine/threonine phosphatase n=1 Tax=Streptomyces TaxID=1883 RepID=UPI000FC0C8A8|nr:MULTISPECIES: PP2C family protein-serine/threonine phosphatase [Streptomyces]NEC70679.1 serine/threonine-protein phosphatase [Streptomyces rochei]RSS30242.1 serine/threonine-protein phosphatase [Streptomyces sp. WAC08452]